jgi:hypothetical protein
MRLLPGERVLWSGSPRRFPFFNPVDKLIGPFGIVGCVLAIGAEIAILRSAAPPFFATLGALFVAAALYATAVRLLVRWLTLRKTRYAVTNLRVITVSDNFRHREVSAHRTALEPPSILPGPDGTGTIVFGDLTVAGQLRAVRTRGGQAKPGLLTPAQRRQAYSYAAALMLQRIEDPEHVLRLLTANRGR